MPIGDIHTGRTLYSSRQRGLMSSSGEAAVVRRARAEDVEQILDLLAHYDMARSYFEPFYLKDPSYRPEHSWVAEQDGCLAAHIRVFDRRVRACGTGLRVAGIGNVITAPEQRGRGHAGRLLEAMLAGTPGEGFAYSLLRAYQPVLYERHGWAHIDQELVRATLSPGGVATVAIERFADEDLPMSCGSTTRRTPAGAERRSDRPSTGGRSSNG